MKRFIKQWIDRIEGLVLWHSPVWFGLFWVRVVRGDYAAYNAEAYFRTVKWLALNQVDGDMAEFGVGSGATSLMTYIFQRKYDAHHKRRFHLFDSFEGLPPIQGDDQHAQWQQGAWAFSETYVRDRAKRYGANLRDLTLTKGYFEHSLTVDTARDLGLKRLALVHIDCDLKTSTETVLQFMRPFIGQGTVLLLDDYYCYAGDMTRGEAGALHEWCAREGIKASPWFAYAFHGQSFILSV